MDKPLLQVHDLRAHFIGFRGQRAVKAVDGVSFSLSAGETLGLVGESGSGKTTTCHAMFRLLPPGGEIVGGAVLFEGEDLMQKSRSEMRQIRGRDMANHSAGPDGLTQPPVFYSGSSWRASLLSPRSAPANLARARREPAEHGANFLAGDPHARFSAPDEWRHAAAYRRGDCAFRWPKTHRGR